MYFYKLLNNNVIIYKIVSPDYSMITIELDLLGNIIFVQTQFNHFPSRMAANNIVKNIKLKTLISYIKYNSYYSVYDSKCLNHIVERKL